MAAAKPGHPAGKVEPANQPEEAELLFRESLPLDANFAEAHYQLGVLREQHNKTNEAMEELKRAGLLPPRIPNPITRWREFTGVRERRKRQSASWKFFRLLTLESIRTHAMTGPQGEFVFSSSPVCS
jgi:tetratricopeptide (TPR) repeat protein